MHNGMLRFTGEKMSKSLGNVSTIRSVLDEWGRETVLLFLLTAHWRKPIDFSPETMEQAAAQVESFRNAFRLPAGPAGDWQRLVDALEDDFNTADALAVMHEWRAAGAVGELRRALELFGLGSLATDALVPAVVSELAERRRAARAARDFAEADRLRAEIEVAGWEMRDKGDGFTLVPRS
jgi:cysteinyl-tRNA synthetase